jgi:hypothetical protein
VARRYRRCGDRVEGSRMSWPTLWCRHLEQVRGDDGLLILRRDGVRRPAHVLPEHDLLADAVLLGEVGGDDLRAVVGGDDGGQRKLRRAGARRLAGALAVARHEHRARRSARRFSVVIVRSLAALLAAVASPCAVAPTRSGVATTRCGVTSPMACAACPPGVHVATRRDGVQWLVQRRADAVLRNFVTNGVMIAASPFAVMVG